MGALDAAMDAKLAAAEEDAYYTKKVGTTGLTQAQIDTRKTAIDVATQTGGTVDPITGLITPKNKVVTPVTPVVKTVAPIGKKVVSTYTDEATGDIVNVYDDGSEVITRKGTVALNAATEKASKEAERLADRKSAYDLLRVEFAKYGLESLVTDVEYLIKSDVSKSEFILKLRESKSYQARFGANATRIKNGLKAINEAEYLGLEDQYQNIMRNYGLPTSYYTRGAGGVQEGFNNFIANDVSASELEDRIMTAQSRVLNANPEVLASLKAFYPDITNGDILAYTLDPSKGLTDIKRKVTAAEIGGAATQAGLGIGGTRAEELGAAGINKAQAQQGFQTVAEVAPRGSELARVFGQDPFTQATAETEVFGLSGSVEAGKKRKKLVGLEQAEFSKSAGVSQGSLSRNRAGQI